MRAKFLATHLLALLDSDARDAINLHKEEYTWKSRDGRVTEYDGLTILAVIFERLRPHYQVDMFGELTKLKAITLKQHNNNLPNYFDAIGKLKAKIDMKDKNFYPEKQFIRDIFGQLKTAPNDSFTQEYSRMESKWLTGKETVTPLSLIRDSTAHYIQLDKDGDWGGKLSASDQIVLLTTKLNAQESEIKALQSNNSNPRQPRTTQNGTGKQPYTVKAWRLEDKGPVLFHGGKMWYRCMGNHWSDGVKYNGMYCDHKTEDHDQWRAGMDKYRAAMKESEKSSSSESNQSSDKSSSSGIAANATSTSTSDAKTSTSTSDAKEPDRKKWKLTMNNQLQSALVTNTNITPMQFQHLWTECEADANDAAPGN